MSTNQLVKKIERLREWGRIMEEAKEEAENLRNELKQELLLRNTEELTAGQYIIRWTAVLTQRFDEVLFASPESFIFCSSCSCRSKVKRIKLRKFGFLDFSHCDSSHNCTS